MSLTLSCVWGTLDPRNPFFTDREAILHLLYQLLSQEKTMLLSQSWDVSGLGGIGKTQTVLEYTYCHSHDYAAIFWINAETTESIISSFATIADLLNLPDKQEPEQEKVITGVIRWLSSHSGWLLIVDNVENPELNKSAKQLREIG